MALPFAKKALARCHSFWRFSLLMLPWLGISLLVIPNASADLVLDFRVSWVLASADGQSVRFLPALSGTASLHPQTVE